MKIILYKNNLINKQLTIISFVCEFYLKLKIFVLEQVQCNGDKCKA